MAVTKRNIKTHLKAKSLDYVNDFFTLKNQPQILKDVFSYNSYNALTNVLDVRTNNYSNLFLTKKQLNTDWLEVHEKPKFELNVVTTLSFGGTNPHDPVWPGIWLYFDKTYTFWDMNIKEAPYYLTLSRPDTNIYNYFFYIEYLNETQCRISHNFGNLVYYLAIDEKMKLYFTAEYVADRCVFDYKLTANELQLFKTVIVSEDGKTTAAVYTLAYQETDDGYALFLSTDLEPNETNIIYINELQNGIELYLNNAYVAYDQSHAITAINIEKSAFYIKSQTLLHHQYNSENTVNFVPLKSNLTYKGGYSRGDNMTISYLEYPDVYYRTYGSISSGIHQEYGNDNIILNYLFTDQILRLEDGDVVDFYVPLPEENNGKNPLYPYKQLNIADSKFVKSGSFASDVPFFSDKVYKHQGENTQILDRATGERLSPNNGVYLCTWLYQMNELIPPTWFDRYYYPDKISRAKALTSEHFEESFENVMDKAYDLPTVNETIREHTYFDKISDLVFEPGNKYKYARISTEMVNEMVETMSPARIEEVQDQDGTLTYLSELMLFDNKHWIRVNHDLFKKTNVVNFNTDIYITNKEKIGIQLFGADYLSGLNIQNRKDLAPYHYYATTHKMYLLNNDFQIRHSFDLYEKYHDTINKFLLGDIFDDVVVVSNLYLYIFTYDLSLKCKIYYGDIMDINNIKINGLKNNLLSYPYNDGHIQINYKESGAVKVNTGKQALVNLGYPVDDTIRIKYEEPSTAIYFESNISALLCDGNAILHNSNIYIPYDQNVLKIIFVPDAERDNFPESAMENYPCKIRVLDYDEYFCNYQRTDATTSQYQEPDFENGFIEVERKIKNLYMSKQNKLYAFNFDSIAISPDDDTMYGLYAWEKYINAGGWYWLYNQSLSKLETQIDSAKFAEFASTESIDKAKVNELGMICLIRGFANMSEDRRLEIYDETKKRFYQYSLDQYEQIYTLDVFKYIDNHYQEHSAFTMLGLRNGILFRVEYLCDLKQLNEYSLPDLPTDMNPNFYQTTNSNMVIKYTEDNNIYFNLFLPSNYLYDIKETIVWDLTDIQTGWYNINVYVNLDEAKFEVRINDIRFADRNDSEHFKPFVNSNGNVFDVTYYIGTLGKKYGTTMFKILSDSGFDPYACKNSKIENARLYTKKLEYHEYQAMRMDGKNINTLLLTVPCGQRPNLDEIVRYFKYVPPSAISNKVKINITGTGLTTRGEFEMLRNEILQTLQNEKDCLIDVNEIEFI